MKSFFSVLLTFVTLCALFVSMTALPVSADADCEGMLVIDTQNSDIGENYLQVALLDEANDEVYFFDVSYKTNFKTRITLPAGTYTLIKCYIPGNVKNPYPTEQVAASYEIREGAENLISFSIGKLDPNAPTNSGIDPARDRPSFWKSDTFTLIMVLGGFVLCLLFIILLIAGYSTGTEECLFFARLCVSLLLGGLGFYIGVTFGWSIFMTIFLTLGTMNLPYGVYLLSQEILPANFYGFIVWLMLCLFVGFITFPVVLIIDIKNTFFE